MGCKCSNFSCKASEVTDILKQHPSYHQRPHLTKEDCYGDFPKWSIDPNKIVKGKTHDMQDFVEQCVDTFCIFGNISKDSLEMVKTPFIDESKDPKDWEIILEKDCENEDDSLNRNRELDRLGEEIKANRRLIEGKNGWLKVVAKSNEEAASAVAVASVAETDNARALSGDATLLAAAAPSPPKGGRDVSEQGDTTQDTNKCTGELADISLKCIMKCMWVARYCRDDCLRAVNACASRVTKWDERDDEKLTRLISYMHNTSDWRQIGSIGDELEDLRLVLYTDAIFAGDHSDMTSTSGGFLCFWGPHSFFPLGSISKKQTCQSLSTTEAETLSAVHGTKLLGCPALDFRETIFGKAIKLDMFQDNQATMRVLLIGKAPTLRHFSRAMERH